MRKILISLCVLLCLSGCIEPVPQQTDVTPTPSPEITLSPTPEITSTTTANILTAVDDFMAGFGYESKEMIQVGETYMTPDYMLAVIRGTYLHGCIAVEQLHLAHLDFRDGGYRVINLYPGQEDPTYGFYPNAVNINGETIIWTTLNSLQSQEMQVYYGSGAYDTVPMDGDSAIFRFKRGVQVTKLVPIDTNGEEITGLTAQGDSLLPLANITHSIGAQIHPMTGEILGVCGYPEAPDEGSKIALTDALQNAGLLQGRDQFSLVAAKEYSGKLYACIHYTRNGKEVYELVIASLTIEGNIDILGVCEFAPPDQSGYKMYSTAFGNDILCWTLLGETRPDGNQTVLMDFNEFRFYWDSEDFHSDMVVDRFFIYMNRHTPLPIRCVPLVNGYEMRELSSSITRVDFHKIG